ncbi:MAG TPA: NAD(P)-dependent oxidoreductase, partial [Burkholderiaceae bacterium]
RGNTALDWTFLSPPALLAPGERTGRYRLGGEELLMDGDKPAGIAVADLAVAIADEIERPRHVRARFTVAR